MCRNPTGHMMFLDGSQSGEAEYKAHLYSPIFKLNPFSTMTCFIFYYHIHGHNTGELYFIIKF